MELGGHNDFWGSGEVGREEGFTHYSGLFCWVGRDAMETDIGGATWGKRKGVLSCICFLSYFLVKLPGAGVSSRAGCELFR